MKTYGQYPMPDPELENAGAHFVEGLKAQPQCEVRQLPAMMVTQLPREKQGLVDIPKYMAAAENPDEGLDQELLAVVIADQEVFGIVNAKTVRHIDKASYLSDERLAVTRLQPDGNRAQLVGFVEPNKPFKVGRGYQEGLDDGTSREHFVVALREDGVIGVADINSTNGTELITARPGMEAPDFTDVSTWSVKSAEMRRAMEALAQPWKY